MVYVTTGSVGYCSSLIGMIPSWPFSTRVSPTARSLTPVMNARFPAGTDGRAIRSLDMKKPTCSVFPCFFVRTFTSGLPRCRVPENILTVATNPACLSGWTFPTRRTQGPAVEHFTRPVPTFVLMSPFQKLGMRYDCARTGFGQTSTTESSITSATGYF